MKFSLVLAALLATGVWTGPANSQNSSSQDKQEQWQSEANERDRPAHAPGKPASIPFKLRDNLVAIDVTLNGRRQSAVLDSGSGALVVDQRTTTALGLAVKEPIGDAAGAGAQAQQLRPVEIGVQGAAGALREPRATLVIGGVPNRSHHRRARFQVRRGAGRL